MHCPICKTDMIIQELNYTEIDHCVDCDGIWLDRGELEMLLGSEVNDPLLNSFRSALSDERPRKCPVCKARMEKIHAGERDEPVLIDRCPKDHGIWFDAGELYKLLETSELYCESKLAKLLREMFPPKQQV